MNPSNFSSDNQSLLPGSVFVVASVSPDTLFSLDHPIKKTHAFGPFDPIPMSMVPIRDMEHLDRMARWDIYIHGHGSRGKLYRINTKHVIKHKATWELDTVEVVDIQRLSLTLGLVKIIDLPLMEIEVDTFEEIIRCIGVFSETTDTGHWTFGVLQYFFNLLRYRVPTQSQVYLPCHSMADAHMAALRFVWSELPNVVGGHARTPIFDLTNKILLTEEDEDIIYCTR
ncbi:hypothetical protein GQ53DRAFT_187158 [Thozetella sp. PMI_491]|nr:hypothetical protein GQ53DRAFT_187158 [Thozetella sp. PMI_491]